jgi:hypothetical protein
VGGHGVDDEDEGAVIFSSLDEVYARPRVCIDLPGQHIAACVALFRVCSESLQVADKRVDRDSLSFAWLLCDLMAVLHEFTGVIRINDQVKVWDLLLGKVGKQLTTEGNEYRRACILRQPIDCSPKVFVLVGGIGTKGVD